MKRDTTSSFFGSGIIVSQLNANYTTAETTSSKLIENVMISYTVKINGQSKQYTVKAYNTMTGAFVFLQTFMCRFSAGIAFYDLVEKVKASTGKKGSSNFISHSK